ncbi:hypothetical protein KCG44_02785 [Pacificimonas sp. WHA3]|uniref:Solute-binding protein family 5 domain-containing protein n=1 Tax=Pacificimonas pallii TaxID=2827236 RepID=A0ABS6SC84_9SPHN|nr:ABC transporter substrate-binding protein [Pacificimonas pallii]MBV7255708.1 hypothetical protein [Pacificimonas pallii]
MRFLIFLLILVPLAACGMGEGTGTGEAPISILIIADEGTGDAGMEGHDTFLLGATHLGLTTRAPDGRIVPSLAVSWRVLDEGRTYIFKLRDAAWPDGRRITAGDVVAVLRRGMAPGSDVPVKPYLMDIAEAEAVSGNRKPARMLGIADPRPDVVEISLDRPYPALLSLLAHPSLAIVRADTPPPPSGPYMVADDTPAAKRLVRNTAFVAEEDMPLSPLILAKAMPDDAIAAFEAGEVDIVLGGRTDGIRRVRTDALSASLRLEPSVGLYGYVAHVARGPLADVRIRRALAMTVAREQLVQSYFALVGMQAAYGPLAPTLPETYAGAVPDWAVWPADVRAAEAQRLLLEAGVSPDTPITLDVALPRGAIHEGVLAQLADGWRDFGIHVRAYKRSAAMHRRAVESGDYDLAVSERIAPGQIPRFFLRPFTCDMGAGGYCNRDADRLLDAAADEVDNGTRINLVRRAARLIAEDAPIIPLFSPVRWALVRPGISGWEQNAAGAHPPQYLKRVN